MRIHHVLISLDPVHAEIGIPLQGDIVEIGGPANVHRFVRRRRVNAGQMMRSDFGLAVVLLQSPLRRSQNAAVLLVPSKISPKRALRAGQVKEDAIGDRAIAAPGDAGTIVADIAISAPTRRHG